MDLSVGLLGLLGTGVLIYISWASLKKPGSHGFFRFFAWVAIWILTLIRLRTWFTNPLSWYQLMSWLLLIVAAGLVLHGIWLLRQVGRQDVRPG